VKRYCNTDSKEQIELRILALKIAESNEKISWVQALREAELEMAYRKNSNKAQ
jgi:hypothetical protein